MGEGFLSIDFVITFSYCCPLLIDVDKLPPVIGCRLHDFSAMLSIKKKHREAVK